MENSNKMDLSFSGAGFMGCYYFGVVDCMNKYIPRERINRVAGASAGSLIAAYYLMDLPLGNCLKEIIGLTEDIRGRPLGVFDRNHQIVDILPKILDKLFPDDAHKRVSGRLNVCITRLKDMKKIIVNEFESKKDLIDALNCSCFIPVWSGNHVSTYKGVKHIDGGFSDNLPVFDEHTIRICCFSGASDISPYDRAKMELLSGTVLNTPLYWNFANFRRLRKALFPPPASYIVDLLERGFHDTKDFILSNDLIQCDPCYMKTNLRDQPIYQRSQSPIITPSASPAISRVGSFRVLNGATFGDENNNTTTPMIKKVVNGKQEKKSFDVLVSEKLLRNSNLHHQTNVVDNNNKSPATPMIVINDSGSSGAPSPDSCDVNCSSSSSTTTTTTSSVESNNSDGSDGLQASPKVVICKVAGSPQCNKRAVPKEQQQVLPGVGARRRSTLHHDESQASSLLVMKDRFTLAPSPLPSCPPSPNLNRHCSECIRLRQEARLDAVERDIRRVAEKFLTPESEQSVKMCGFKDKLASPLRWLKTLGTKSSYKFETNSSNSTTDNRQHLETSLPI